MQQHTLRACVARLGVGPNRLEAKSVETIGYDSGDRFSGVSLAPIGLTQPIAEGWFRAARPTCAANTDTSHQAVVLLQCDGETTRSAGSMIGLYKRDPVAACRFR